MEKDKKRLFSAREGGIFLILMATHLNTQNLITGSFNNFEFFLNIFLRSSLVLLSIYLGGVK